MKVTVVETHPENGLETLLSALVVFHARLTRGEDLQQAGLALQQAVRPMERVVEQLRLRAEASSDPELYCAYRELVAYTEQARAALDEVVF
jgi:hypothetical protein